MTLDEVKEKINNLVGRGYRTNSRIVRIESWITIEDLIMILATLEDGEQFNQLNEVKNNEK